MAEVQKRERDTETWCRGCLGRQLTPVGEKSGFALMRCHDCGTTVVDPYPSNAELAEFYAGYRLTGSYLKKQDRKFKRGLGRVKKMLWWQRQKVSGYRLQHWRGDSGSGILGAGGARD